MSDNLPGGGDDMRLVQLFVHPVKSMRGNAVGQWDVEVQGMTDDRRWMVVDERHRFVTGRLVPAISRCLALVTGDGLRLEHDGQVFDVDTPATGRPVDVVVWSDTVQAFDAGDGVADWLSDQFGRSLRLVWQADPRSRPLAEKRRATPDDVVSFADGYPLLAMTTASLAELNGRLELPVTARNFRPNLVIDTETPFEEDGWHTIDVGGVPFRAISPCSRCIFTTVDPATGQKREDREPLATLSGYRRDAETGKILFGVNLIPLETGRIGVGDPVSLR
ncbi:MAG: MOSC N-terminal beta barrel domain-containing protein [Pseudomonadota bacterium]